MLKGGKIEHFSDLVESEKKSEQIRVVFKICIKKQKKN